VHDARIVAGAQTLVEIVDAFDKARGKDADATIIEKIDAARHARFIGKNGIIAEMRIAVDHPIGAERHPPRLEHRDRHTIAHLLRGAFE
jgi:hypothetical protein